MGLFKQKKSEQKVDDRSLIFDDEFREELREQGREHLKQVIEDNAKHLKQDIDITMSQIGTEMREYMMKQLDTTMSHINDQVSRQLQSRMSEYDRVTKDAHDLAVQSLNRSAHALHEQYEQFNSALQKSIAGQEAMMIATYDENRARIHEIDDIQERTLESLEKSIERSERQRNRLDESLNKAVAEQERLVNSIFEETKTRVNETKEAQQSALDALNQSAEKLQEQYRQLNSTLQKNVSEQKEVMIGAFQEDMARIVEYYLMQAFGDQYDIKEQLPLIIKQMEENKQAIVDDIRL